VGRRPAAASGEISGSDPRYLTTKTWRYLDRSAARGEILIHLFIEQGLRPREAPQCDVVF
jgi:hypothetical protein